MCKTIAWSTVSLVLTSNVNDRSMRGRSPGYWESPDYKLGEISSTSRAAVKPGLFRQKTECERKKAI